MEVSFTIDVRLPDAEVENIVFDEWGNAEITLSAGGVLAKCSIDATGSDHGTIRDALLSLAGIQITKTGQKPCQRENGGCDVLNRMVASETETGGTARKV